MATYSLINTPRGAKSSVYGKSAHSNFKVPKSYHGQALGQDKRTTAGKGSYKTPVTPSLEHPVSKANTYNGKREPNVAPPMPRTKIAYGTAKAPTKLRQKTKRHVALASSIPPMPRPKAKVSRSTKGGGFKAAFKANAGNNQAKALARMKKASRR